MKLKIKVHANSSQEKIKKLNDSEFEVWLKEKTVDGKANLELVKLLTKYFNTHQVGLKEGRTPRRRENLSEAPKHFSKKCLLGAKEVKIKSGFTSRMKIVEVFD